MARFEDLIPATVVDLRSMGSIDGFAHSITSEGCWVVSDDIDQLNEVVGLQLEGFDGLFRGKVIAIGDEAVQILFTEKKAVAHDERRSEVRRPVWLTAVVTSMGAPEEIECQVVDASRSGCRLEDDRVSELPDDIFISIPGAKKCVSATIVWRNGRQAGVRLNWQTAPKPPAKPKKPVKKVQQDNEAADQKQKKKRVSAFGG
ncbi:PilZ domain-containing protein [Roseibium denhamense]|uniref:PilZ domain-containing protein n=1 Tax=Roseibium denhamense TaxID=76305 RepID=UPI0018AD2EF8|nr:PilZ domain-containing protein [Roseibium denhamense]